MSNLIDVLNSIPLAGLMLVVAVGFTLGRITWRGFSLGPAGGTIVVALALGALGLRLSTLYGTEVPPLTAGKLGFALFIYSVGFEAGPQFFSAFRGGPGWRFVVLGAVVSLVALAVALVLGAVLGLGEAVTAGILSGALTSAPTYAAAAEVCADHAELAVTFALTYPIGLAGVVLLIHFLPRFLGDDFATHGDEGGEGLSGRARHEDQEFVRSFRVENDGVVGPTLAELDLTHRTGCYVTRLHRGDSFMVPDADTRLEMDDHLMAKGRVDELRTFSGIVGAEIYDADLRRRMPAPRRVHVVSALFAGKTLLEIGMPQKHRCLVIGVDRRGVCLEPAAELVIERGDVLEVVGEKGRVRAVAEEMGRFEHSTNETDIAIYAGGICLGLLIGNLELPGLGFTFSIGSAGGLLLMGILLGRFQRIGRFSANVPAAARQLVRDLGILLFVAEAGVVAGESALVGLTGYIAVAILASVLVTAIPVIVAVLIGRRIFRMRPVDTWGSTCGGMTSSSALVAIRRAAESDAPALSYAASYAVAGVLATIAGPVVVYLL